MPVRYILSSVWVRLIIFSQLSVIQYMGLCVFSVLISLVMIERIYTLSYYRHQIGSMIYYPLFRVMPWNNGMRCMFLCILTGLMSCGCCLITVLWFIWHLPALRKSLQWHNLCPYIKYLKQLYNIWSCFMIMISLMKVVKPHFGFRGEIIFCLKTQKWYNGIYWQHTDMTWNWPTCIP